MRVFLYRFILHVFIFALSAPCLAVAGDVPSDDLKKEAREGLNKFFRNHKIDSSLKSKGFESQADLDTTELGEGFPIYNLDPGKLQDDSAPQALQDLAVIANEWRFPVISGGKAKTFLRVGFFSGQWISHEMGRSSLATEFNGVMAAWPASSGYSFRYIRALRTSADFIVLSRGGKVVGIIPITALMAKTGRTAGDIKSGDLRDPQEFLNDLRLRFKEDNKPFRPPSDEVMKAAKDVLDNHVKKHGKYALAQFGFESQAELDNAELGEGFQVYRIDSDKLLDDTAPHDFQSLVKPTREWLFPIISNSKIKSIIRVHFANGRWEFGGMGIGEGVARELAGLKAAWPSSSGYQHRYVISDTSLSYFELSQGGKVTGVISLFSLTRTKGRVAGEFKPEYLRDPQEVQKELLPEIKQNREWNRQNGDNQTDGNK